jgi:hypothetical protein
MRLGLLFFPHHLRRWTGSPEWESPVRELGFLSFETTLCDYCNKMNNQSERQERKSRGERQRKKG